MMVTSSTFLLVCSVGSLRSAGRLNGRGTGLIDLPRVVVLDLQGLTLAVQSQEDPVPGTPGISMCHDVGDSLCRWKLEMMLREVDSDLVWPRRLCAAARASGPRHPIAVPFQLRYADLRRHRFDNRLQCVVLHD